MSGFSAVDSSADPDRLIAYLDRVGLAAMRQYMAVTHATRGAGAPVLDLGCGIGRDLSAFVDAGLVVVGADPSGRMLQVAVNRVGVPLVRANGEHLPFAHGAFSGCSMQRVLLHVDDPSAVVAEAVRCVRSGGVLTVFEPDWSQLTVHGSPMPIGWISSALHPSIGGSVGALLTEAGCVLRDRVEERSWWTFDELERNTNLQPSLDRAVASGTASRRTVDDWLAHHRRPAADRAISAEMVKVLWVATVA